MGFLEKTLYILGSRVVFLGEVEGADGGFEILSIKLALRFSNEAGERVGI